MMNFRRILCIVLCCIVLAGCGNTAQSATPATEPTFDPVAPFLEMAQGFVDQVDYDGAISVLKQALETMDDPRLYTMLAEIRDLRSVPLTVRATLLDTNMPEDVVVIHSITAEHLYTSEVVYTVTYTAPEGMIPQLWGRNLFYAFSGETTGGQETLIFSIKDQDVRRMFREFQLAFAIPEQDLIVFDVKTWWATDEDATQEEASAVVNDFSTYELCYWFLDVYDNAGFKVNSFRVEEDGEDCHFTVEYTASKAMKADGYIGTINSEEYLWEEEILAGENALEFTVSKAVIADNTYLTLIITGEAGVEVDLSIDLPLRMRHTFGKPVTDSVNLGYSLTNPWQSDAYQIHSITAMELDNGYIRYALDITLPKEAYFTASYIDRKSAAHNMYTTTSTTGRQTFYLDMEKGALMNSIEVTVLICEVASRHQNLIIIPSSWITAMAEGEPVSNPTQLQWSAEGRSDYKAESFTVEPLDNGYFRFTMRFSAPAGEICGVIDPPNGDYVKFKWILEEGKTEHTISFDLSKETLEAVTCLTMYVDTFEDMTVVIQNIPQTVGSTATPVEITNVSREMEGAE